MDGTEDDVQWLDDKEENSNVLKGQKMIHTTTKYLLKNEVCYLTIPLMKIMNLKNFNEYVLPKLFYLFKYSYFP